MKKFSDFLKERCWPGYKSVPGKKAYSSGSCMKEEDMEEGWSQKYKSSIDCNNPKGFSQKAHCAGKKKNESISEDLRKWFSKTDPAGDWKRINSKGEAIGPCAREPGEPKPKCMSRAKRNSLTKKERASAVASKRKHDPNPERKGEPINVSNFGKGKISEDMENLDEKNVPTSPEKWAQAKSQAKAKFDVYPSAYANGWAAKKYKAMGGGWKSVSEDNKVTEGAVPAQEKIITVKHKTSGKTLRISAGAAAKYRMQGYHYHPVNEAKDEQEYGYEGDMALNQLATLTRCAEMIKDLLKPDTDMPEWVQSKITLATDYIQTAADYLYSEMKESVEQIDEISKKTLGSYVNKATSNIADKSAEAQHKRTKAAVDYDDNIRRGMSKKGADTHLNRGYDSAKPDTNKVNSRMQGVQKAISRLAKENVEQVDEISQDLAGKYLEKVTHDQLKKSGMHHNLYGQLPPKRQAGVGRALDRLVVNKESVDNGGTVPTPAAETLTVNGQPKLSKTVGQTKLVPFVHEAKETKPPFDGPYTTTKAVIKDKSGAKHTPMSRARDLARKAMAKNMKEQSNVTPNPFTVPEIDIGKAPKKSRQMNIVREAMADAKKKKKEVTEAGTDKFITDPELASQITKS
jgi:hypothetical protein